MSSFFNTVRQAIFHFKPNGFDFRKATKKLLCINPSFVPGHDPCNRLILLSEVEKIFVFGINDFEGCAIIPKLKERDIPKLQIKMVKGANHEFKDMVDEFISLIDLL